ncbi:hypothetical protein ABEB36_006443 [Hypothenemus hampei]|uniref:F-box domain-containing protein n=1 Tax=Hypothenemus hampei TaxID=57062 RepID=A0ABD1EQJ0_HYPHA
MNTHSGSFCIKSVKQGPVKVEIGPSIQDFSLGESIVKVFPLLELIFNYLTIDELKVCLQVCQEWKDIATEQISKRVGPSWFTCYKIISKKRKANVIEHSPNLNYNNVELGFIVYDKFRLNKFICLHNNVTELSRKNMPEYLEEELVPKNVEYCLLSVHRIASCFKTSRWFKDVQCNGSTFDGILFPKIPSMRTVMFHCNPSTKKAVENMVNTYIRPFEHTKCLLLFTKTRLYNGLSNLLQYIVPHERHQEVALAGGVIRGTKTFQKFNQSQRLFSAKDTICIAFLKDSTNPMDNFNAYSCVITNTDTIHKKDFDKQLMEFKNGIRFRKHCIGLRVACSQSFLETELQSFEEILPDVPILGLEAQGEIGWNCYYDPVVEENERNQKKRLKKSNYPTAQWSFSTVVVLITWD